MSKPERLKFRDRWRETFRTPKYTLLPDGLPMGYVFSMFKPKYPKYVVVPMQSGNKGLFKLLTIETPSDPGDMHIPRWAFVKYLKEPKS